MTTDREDDWFTLLRRMKAGAVVPVVGPDLLRLDPVEGEAGTQSLYHRVGSQLAASIGKPLDTDTATWPLFAGVGQCLAQQSGSVDKLRSKVARFVGEATPDGLVVPAVLRQLASVEAFSLYISLTCDDLLPRALQAVDPQAYRRAFAIRTADAAIDIPAPPPRRGVYQLLGSADNLLDFAIHDGDVVEYLYRLQSEHSRSLRLLLGELRKRDLLFIGCRLPDWLGRSLLRLASGDALPSKSTQDYVCDPGADPHFTTFLSRHSPNTLLFDGDAAPFVAELVERWQRVRPQPAVPAAPAAAPGGAGVTVFVSYASEDADAARLLADQLLALGAADVWLDKRKLRGGDDWADRIDEAIDRQCSHFMPVLSRQADARREGVFWQEWARALRRAERVADAFVLPTVIDADPAARSGYQRIGRFGDTARFFQMHLLQAPGGLLDEPSRDGLRDLFAGRRD